MSPNDPGAKPKCASVFMTLLDLAVLLHIRDAEGNPSYDGARKEAKKLPESCRARNVGRRVLLIKQRVLEYFGIRESA